ncbi:uncharacterized protein LOC143029018 [Oratosquilla oratoria]|uniref:uncharacterized protein LOC143029018 n=1 Tax=Oratosquilla oratoria TaxID=337810 RepID=UPI003F75C03D
MARRKSLSNERISEILLQSDVDKDTDDIRDEEFIPQVGDASSDCSDADEDISEDVTASSVAVDTKYLQSPSGDCWFFNEPSSQGRMKSLNILTSQSGVTAYTTNRITEDPCTAVDLLFDRDMMGTILVETNKQGQQICQDWKLITENELRAYVGFCILRGVYRSKNQAVRQLWSPEFGPPIFSKTMSVKRFEDIRRALTILQLVIAG